MNQPRHENSRHKRQNHIPTLVTQGWHAAGQQAIHETTAHLVHMPRHGVGDGTRCVQCIRVDQRKAHGKDRREHPPRQTDDSTHIRQDKQPRGVPLKSIRLLLHLDHPTVPHGPHNVGRDHARVQAHVGPAEFEERIDQSQRIPRHHVGVAAVALVAENVGDAGHGGEQAGKVVILELAVVRTGNWSRHRCCWNDRNKGRGGRYLGSSGAQNVGLLDGRRDQRREGLDGTSQRQEDTEELGDSHGVLLAVVASDRSIEHNAI